MCLKLKPAKRPYASDLLKNKFLSKHIEEDAKYCEYFDLPEQSIMATIQPSSNINLMKNRLPKPKYTIKANSDKNMPKFKETLESKDSPEDAKSSTTHKFGPYASKSGSYQPNDKNKLRPKSPAYGIGKIQNNVKSKFIKRPVCPPVLAHESGPKPASLKGKGKKSKGKKGKHKHSQSCAIF